MSPLTLQSPGAIAIHIGSLTVRWYGIMIALGFLVAAWAASFLSKKRGLDTDALLNCALTSFVGGILGARLYFVALNWQTFSVHPEEILATWLGGLSIHGGIIGGLIAGALYCRFAKLPFLTGCDIFGAVLPLAQSIGRWGNFFNSEAFGRPVPDDFPIRLFILPNYRPELFATFHYFHPTFLYESLWDLAIFGLLYFVLFDRLKKYPGMNFLAYVLLYNIGRFFIEQIRVDSIMVGGFAAPTVVSATLVIIAAIGLAASGYFYSRRQSSNTL